MVIDGQKIAADILKKLKAKINKLKKQGKTLKLACVLVGKDSASLSFIRRKEKSCQELGIDFKLFRFSEDIQQNILIEKIKNIQRDQSLSGLIVQLPLPKNINQFKVLAQIKPELDVDCLAPENLGRLTAGRPLVLPPTASAILHILKFYKIKLSGKYIVVVGRGNLVGKPLAILLTQEKNTVTSCNKYTKNLAKITLQADILISAVGKRNLITGKMAKKGAVVLDAGTVFYKGKINGDVKFNEVKKKAKLISSVPGGVGPVMVVMLLKNILILAKKFV
ncbi:MAG: tetrahydrofolate dehydrogenase/cyclohydrolase catalytic domain-containing protein [Patescibacteria group bacterium]